MRPTPIDRESSFSVDEMFFSCTDKKGLIECGNSVFVRVSKYPKEKLVKRPHNIVRHPEMPRLVFELLWRTIEKGEPIAAYVKNMAADGSFYWVLATVFPTEKGYLSIRIKPTSELLGVVQQLYPVLKNEEEKKGNAKAVELLMQSLRTLGFESYQEFMSVALLTEMKSRDAALHQRRDQYSSLSSSLDIFSQTYTVFRKRTEDILTACRDLSLMSFNMAVSSKRIGATGAGLSVIAKTFQNAAQNAQDILSNFEGAMALGEKVRKCQFSVAVSRLQIAMVEKFAEEPSVDASSDLGEYKTNERTLLDLAMSYLDRTKDDLTELRNVLIHFQRISDELKEVIATLEALKHVGTIEASRTGAQIDSFAPHFEWLKNFLMTVKESIADVDTETLEMLEKVKVVCASISSMTHDVNGRLHHLAAGPKADEQMRMT